MRRALTLAILFIPATAFAAPTRESVERLLAGYELHASPADFKQAGTDKILVEIASDPSTPGIRRVRALAALAFTKSPLARDYCRQVIAAERDATEGREVLDVGACAHTLGTFKETLPELLSLLDHESAEVRLGAVRGLSQIHAPESAAPMQRRLSVERDAEVRAQLAQTLKALRP